MSWLALASVGVFGAVALGVAGLRSLWRGAARARPTDWAISPTAPGAWRWSAPLLRPLAAAIAPRLPQAVRRRLEDALRVAGMDDAIDAATVVAAQVALCLLLALSAGVAGSALRAAQASQADAVGPGGMLAAWGGVLAGAVLGALLPVLRLQDQARVRRARLLRQLPALLDLLTVALEAGQGLSSALALAADRLPRGPLQAELDRVLREVRTGRPRAEALGAMATRLRMPAMSHLVSALVTGARQGANLGPLLRAQAAQRRHERFVRAERLALQAPVKLLMPLACCVFPGTFAVLFFPVAVRLLQEGVL